MTHSSPPPTPYPEINRLLDELLRSAQGLLGDEFTGMYLDGSLVNGDFDQDSDIDFVVVTENEISEDVFVALREMHARLSALDTIWAIQLEGSYISRRALRRYDSQHTLYPNIERGQGERLKLTQHGQPWDVHRWVLREKGLALAGPDPCTLIDPVQADQLRAAMAPALSGWAASLLADPSQITHRGYQSYIVLTLCRILYTLYTGTVGSKRTAAAWAGKTLGEEWRPLIEDAWDGRHNGGPLTQEAVEGTLRFIRFAQGEKSAHEWATNTRIALPRRAPTR